MLQPTSAAAPRGCLRIVKSTAGKSIVVAFPLPARSIAPQSFSSLQLSTATVALPTYDRTAWERHSNSPRHLQISTILRSLGLRQFNNGPGRIVFQSENVTELAEAIAGVVTRLPHSMEELLDAASDYTNAQLHEEITQLLDRFGDEIWGASKERTWLLQASESNAEYQNDLVFGDAADRDTITYHLRSWILVRAFNACRSRIHQRAKPAFRADRGNQAKWYSTAKVSESPLPALRTQSRDRNNTLATAPAISFSRSDPSLGGSTVEPTGPVSYDMQVRKTARKPKPRNLDTSIYSSFDSEPEEELQSDSDTTNDIPRYYKGKGRAWKKTESDEDPVFKVMERSETRKTPTNGHLSGPSGRPNGSKKEKVRFKVVVGNKALGDDVVVGDEALSMPDHAFSTLQEHIDSRIKEEELRKKRKRRPPRKYISEEVIRNSSDDNDQFDEDTILTHTSTREEVRSLRGTNTRTPARRTGKQTNSSERTINITGPRSGSQNSLSAPDAPARSSSVMPLARRSLPMNQYWDQETWRYVHLRGNERVMLLQTMQSLGLDVVLTHPIKFQFEKKNFAKLDKDINMIAQELSNQFSANQLIQFAADSDYLNEHIDSLFAMHSPIWSLDADRSQLLVPGVNENYPQHLFYEESEGQRLSRLWIHLHRWIFIIALKNCRQMWGKRTCDMDKALQPRTTQVPQDMVNVFQLKGTYTWTVPDESPSPPSVSDGSSGSASPIERETVTERTLKDCERDLLEAIGKFLEDERSGRSEEIAEPTPAPKKRKKDPNSTTNGTDLCALFMSYLELYKDPQFDELTALKNLARECALLEKHATRFHTRKGIKFATAFFVDAFPAWLLYRQDIANVKRKFTSMQCADEATHHHVEVMVRSRLATELRRAHDAFMRAGYGSLRPEQVIHRAFITLQNENANSSIAEDIRVGFKGMEEELAALADRLIDGGARWVMGDFSSITNFKGMGPHTRIHGGLYHRNYD